jgi:transcription initiation factor TFIID subunit TAF12
MPATPHLCLYSWYDWSVTSIKPRAMAMRSLQQQQQQQRWRQQRQQQQQQSLSMLPQPRSITHMCSTHINALMSVSNPVCVIWQPSRPNCITYVSI